MQQKKLGFLGWVILVLNVICAIGLILSYLARYFDPAAFWQMAFFGLAYPAFFFSNIGFLIFWVIRRHKLMLLPLIVILIGWNVHKNVFQLSLGQDEAKKWEGSLRVMTYNVHNFTNFDKNSDANTKRKMLSLIRKEQPDVICFQEFYTRKKGEFDIKDSLANYLGTKDIYFIAIDANENESIGMAIFSKYPIKKKKHVPFRKGSINSCMYADIEVKGQTMRVFNIHLQSISFKPEDYRYLKNVQDDLEADINSSKKIGVRLLKAFQKRSKQAHLVAEQIMESPHPVIVCGDFNDTPTSYAYATIAAGLQNTFTEKGSGYSRTYGGMFPNFQIDYILVDKRFKVLDYQVIKEKLSDHFPVRSDILLPEAPKAN